MLSFKAIELYAQLQQKLLSCEDSSLFLKTYFEFIYNSLSELVPDIDYLAGLFVADSGEIDCYYQISKPTNTLSRTSPSTENKEEFARLLAKHSQLHLSSSLPLIAPQSAYPDMIPNAQHIELPLKTLLSCQVSAGNKIKAYLLVGSSQTQELSDELQYYLQVYSNMAGYIWRLEHTEKNLTEIAKELYKSNAELHQLDKMKDQLIAVTSHELRTPASVIQNYLWMVLHKPAAETSLSEKDYGRIEVSLKEVQHLIKLINDIMDASKIEGGRIELNPVLTNYPEIIDQAVQELQQKATEKGIQITTLYETENRELYIDPLRFREVITNLISNAVKYTDKGTIVVKVDQEQHNIIFSVTDTGRGMAPEFIPKLFKKFYREDTSLQSSNPDTGGTGLGLYITKSLTELMKGSIWVESVLGQGSTFYISFPTQEKSVSAPLAITQPIERKRILLIEDDSELRSLYSEYLSEQYLVETAEHGEEGLRMLALQRYDAILLDLLTPRVNGIQFLTELQAKFHSTPVIVMTNSADEDLIRSTYSLGAKHVIIKSQITPDKIPPVINRHL